MARTTRFGFGLGTAMVLGGAAVFSTAFAGCSAASGGGESGDGSDSEHFGKANFGVSPDVLGINVATDAPGGDAVAKLGATWARVELVDHSTGPELSQETIQRVW